MSGPGEYRADRTEGITCVEDLPKAKSIDRSRNYLRRPCPQCSRSCYRNRTVERTLHDLGDLVPERPRDIPLSYSQHYCCQCLCYFNVDTSDLAPPKSHYTHRVIALAVRLVVEDGLPYPPAPVGARPSRPDAASCRGVGVGAGAFFNFAPPWSPSPPALRVSRHQRT